MSDMRCGKCGQALALADMVCASCGEAVPAEKRAAVLGARAEAFADAGQYAEAARAAEAVAALPLPLEGAKLWRRKRGSWLQRAGRPQLLDAAEACLSDALRLDDSDDLSHQLWMDLLQKRGSMDKARAWYKQRLVENPEDAAAKRHLASLRLLEDFKLAAPPKLSIPPAKEGMLMQAIRPNPWKMITVGFGFVSCLYMMVSAWTATGQQPALLEGAESMASIMKLAEDPWFNGFQLLIYGVYLVWGWKELRGR